MLFPGTLGPKICLIELSLAWHKEGHFSLSMQLQIPWTGMLEVARLKVEYVVAHQHKHVFADSLFQVQLRTPRKTE